MLRVELITWTFPKYKIKYIAFWRRRRKDICSKFYQLILFTSENLDCGSLVLFQVTFFNPDWSQERYLEILLVNPRFTTLTGKLYTSLQKGGNLCDIRTMLDFVYFTWDKKTRIVKQSIRGTFLSERWERKPSTPNWVFNVQRCFSWRSLYQ